MRPSYLLRELVRRDLASRYRGSVLGFVWAFVTPLWQLALYTLVFSFILRVPLENEGTRLSVGVGVASGPAFVGSVRAIDRNIWSALGNTTNLAARLEKLTRDLDVQVAVDAATWTAAGPFGEGFEARPAQRIRGRTEPVDVYVLAFSRT